MLLSVPPDTENLAPYLGRFIDLVGQERWRARCDQFDLDQRRSAFRWKIVSDYHWLEMAISSQVDVLARAGRLSRERTDGHMLAALNFVAAVVEIHARLSPQGRRALEGRLRDSLKAETGFAALYLEIDLARRLMGHGYEVEFTDMEGKGRFDLLFCREAFVGEVECKSLSADAGRQIHRKDFYRFMEAIKPALEQHLELRQREILAITLKSRLPSNTAEQKYLVNAVSSLLSDDSTRRELSRGVKLERHSYAERLGHAPLDDQKALYKACGDAFGTNGHVAGALTEDAGCLVFMRSKRQDDPSKPKLQAMRKAARQFTGERPAFIAIQEHGIEPADLLLPHVRRKAGILSYALFGHYGASHINAVCITGFEAVLARNDRLATPGFAIPNPQPKFPVGPSDAAPFLEGIADANFAEVIGVPLPAPNISFLPIDPSDQH